MRLQTVRCCKLGQSFAQVICKAQLAALILCVVMLEMMTVRRSRTTSVYCGWGMTVCCTKKQ